MKPAKILINYKKKLYTKTDSDHNAKVLTNMGFEIIGEMSPQSALMTDGEGGWKYFSATKFVRKLDESNTKTFITNLVREELHKTVKSKIGK